MGNFPVIIFDFETTGLSPQLGDRPIEIGAVLLEDSKVTHRFQSLMNPGFTVSSFIESYTGIGNDMVQSAPPCEEVMEQFAEFIGNYPLVAHNASFDLKFLDSELRFIGKSRQNAMACSMLTARRVYPDAPNHQLGTLVRYCGVYTDGTFHRALADAEMTGRLWIAMIEKIKNTFGVGQVTFDLMQKLSKISKAKTPLYLRNVASQQGNAELLNGTER
jgi:DNA polymerase-3 subunit epsilon